MINEDDSVEVGSAVSTGLRLVGTRVTGDKLDSGVGTGVAAVTVGALVFKN